MTPAQKFITRALSIAALAGAAGAVQAQQASGPYALIGGGRSDYNVDCSGATSCDQSGNVLQLIGGYGFGNGWAVEGLYANLGKVSARDGTLDVSIKGTALGAGGAYTANFSPAFGATVRLGLASVKLEGRASAFNVSGTVSESKAKPYLGLGLHYNFSKSTAAELGFLRTSGEIAGDDGDITALTVSLRFAF